MHLTVKPWAHVNGTLVASQREIILGALNPQD